MILLPQPKPCAQPFTRKKRLDLRPQDREKIIAIADLIRTGNEQGLLLNNWPIWKKYREVRGKTSHSYDEEIALKVVACIPEFLHEAMFLCQKIREKQL